MCPTDSTIHRLTLCLALSAATLPAGGRGLAEQSQDQVMLPPQRVADSQHFRPRQPAEQDRVIAAGGYCLVTLSLEQKWVPGDPRIRVTRGNKQYLFANLRLRDIFVANPERYLPVLDGDCLVTFAETGRRVPGILEQGLVCRGRVLFFASGEQLARFQAEPEKFLTADLVNGGNCIVSQVDENRAVPGLPETVLTVEGMRLFFASAFHRTTFLTNPGKYLVALGGKLWDSAEQVGAGHLETNTDSVLERPRNPLSSNEEPSHEGPELGAEQEVSAIRTAMGGYCPVTIQTQGIWKLGRSKYTHEFDGRSYHMAGPDELALFAENPRKFAPVFSGDCLVTYVSTRNRVPGSVYHALRSQGRLYLFAGAAERNACKRESDSYLNADLALGGLSAVSYVDDQSEVQGLPEFEALYQGKRYWFSNAEQQQKFQASPQIYAER